MPVCLYFLLQQYPIHKTSSEENLSRSIPKMIIGPESTAAAIRVAKTSISQLIVFAPQFAGLAMLKCYSSLQQHVKQAGHGSLLAQAAAASAAESLEPVPADKQKILKRLLA
jgi:hypothetical protein